MSPVTAAPEALRASPPDEETQVQAALVTLLYRKSSQVRFTNYFAIALAAIVFWPHVPHSPLLAWAGLSCLQTTFHIALDRYYLSHLPKPEEAPRWGWIFTFFSVLAGALWGLPGILFFRPDNMFVTGFVCIIIGSISAGSVAPLAPFKPAYYAAALTIVLPFAIRALLHGGTLFTALGLLALLLLWVNFTSCHHVHKSLRESVLLRFENLSLMRQLIAEKERAEGASRAKTQFLAAASHDLGQPAHALSLFVATLEALGRRPQLRPGDVAGITQRMRTTLASMSQLLDSLLEMSRLDAGVVVSSGQTLALQPALDALRDEFSGPAQSRGLALTVEPSALCVHADPQLLRSVLGNLVSNAVRYTESGGIHVSCRREGGEVRILVADTGIGIAQDQLSKIFQEFYQVGNVVRSSEKGLGLGLSIVQRYVDLLHGRMEVQSRQAEGSTFSVLLRHAGMSESQQPSLAAGPDATPSGCRVLVIDDDPVVLEATCQLLGMWGYAALAASNQEEAVALARWAPGLAFILADYRLANHATGIDAIMAVHAVLGRATQAFIVTSDAAAAPVVAAHAGRFELLHKPVDPQELRTLLASRHAAALPATSRPG